MDRSITNPEIFVKTNVEGTVNMLQCAKNAWYRDGKVGRGQKVSAGLHGRGVRQPGRDRAISRRPLRWTPTAPYSASKTSADLFVKKAFWRYLLACL